MSIYTVYNIFSGGCIGALVMTYFLWRQERRHRTEVERIREAQLRSTQQVIAEIKNVYNNVK